MNTDWVMLVLAAIMAYFIVVQTLRHRLYKETLSGVWLPVGALVLIIVALLLRHHTVA